EVRLKRLWQDLGEQLTNKTGMAAELELHQVEKAGLQKKIEHLQGWLAELDTPAVDSSGKELPVEQKAKRRELFDSVSEKLIEAKDELKKLSRNMAEASAELEQSQMRVAQA